MVEAHQYILAYSVPLDDDVIVEDVDTNDSAHDVPSLWRTARGGIETLVSARQQWASDGFDCRVDKIVIGMTGLRDGNLLLVFRLTTTDDIFSHTGGFHLLANPRCEAMRAFNVSADHVHAFGIADESKERGVLPSVRELSAQEEAAHLSPLTSLLDNAPCVLVKFIRNDDTTAPCRFPPSIGSMDGLNDDLDCHLGSSASVDLLRPSHPPASISSSESHAPSSLKVDDGSSLGVVTALTDLEMPAFSLERALLTADQPALVSDTEVIDLTKTDTEQVARTFEDASASACLVGSIEEV